jgi:hypothetical protein
MLSEAEGNQEAYPQWICMIQVSEAKLFDDCHDGPLTLFILRMVRVL